jgi:hypothetical protein
MLGIFELGAKGTEFLEGRSERSMDDIEQRRVIHPTGRCLEHQWIHSAAVFGLEKRGRASGSEQGKHMVALFRGVFAFEMVLSHEMERTLI